MAKLLDKGLTATAAAWPELRAAYGWVHRAAHLLSHPEEQAEASAEAMRCAYDGLLDELAPFQDDELTPFHDLQDDLQDRPAAPASPAATSELLRRASAQFLKVTKSYGAGLFHCYEVTDLPRTNNDLEQFFGAARYHERRASGRQSASPSTVVRGAVRLVAAAVTRQQPLSAEQLRPQCLEKWRTLRRGLEQRHEKRRQQRRFRRNPPVYLAAIEEQLLKAVLPM